MHIKYNRIYSETSLNWNLQGTESKKFGFGKNRIIETYAKLCLFYFHNKRDTKHHLNLKFHKYLLYS